MKKKLILLCICFLIVLSVSCSLPSKSANKMEIITTIQEHSPTISITRHPSSTPSPNQTIASTATNEPIDSISFIKNTFDSLDSDLYILFEDEDFGLSLISMNGKHEEILSTSYHGFPISADGRIIQLTNKPYGKENGNSLNLLTGEVTQNEMTGLISPNGDWTIELVYTDIYEEGLNILNQHSGETFFIHLKEPFDPKEIVFDYLHKSVRWSPDGKYIFYQFETMRQEAGGTTGTPPWNVLPTNGLYIMNANCLSKPDTCRNNTQFIYSPYKISYFAHWGVSPDGQIVVNDNRYDVIIFDINTNNVRRIDRTREDTGKSFSDTATISPDNQWLAYSSTGENIMLQSLENGETIQLKYNLNSVTVLGWVTGPLLRINESFIVQPAGEFVRIRQLPDLDSEGIGTLFQGNTFTVLDGPIQEDGYTWWYVESAVDGTKGWISEFYGWYEKIESNNP